MKRNVPTPHDLFVKTSLKDINIARAFLKTHLPQEIQKRIDFNSLVPTDKEFILPELKRIQSDIIYKCLIDNQDSYIHFLIEHMSTAESMLPFRRLQYNVALMDDHLRQGNKKLPSIISLCLYHGTKSPYPYSTDIHDCFENPELSRQYSFQPMKLIDLTVMDDETLQEHGLNALMELLLKHHSDKQIIRFLKNLQESGKLSRLLSAIDDGNYPIIVLDYLMNTGDDPSSKADDVIDILTKALPQYGDQFMTFAQQLKHEGMQQGMQQGMQHEKYEIAKNMLRDNEPLEKVCRFTGLDLEIVAKLEQEIKG